VERRPRHQDITEDPLEYYGLTTTVILASAFNIPMMRARGSRRGMSAFILWVFRAVGRVLALDDAQRQTISATRSSG
jgi:hypothetical protein